MITKADVEHVALLGRLYLSEEEKERYTDQLNAILEYAQMLQKLDTENVPPTAHALPMQNVFREDCAGDCLTNEEVLSNAPEREEEYFKVPKII
ncbi:glutamyl-tRNA(Gln) amidotransferase, C subunit [Desulfofarcimen acetoxidans DSM 771]|uniref:Aspartyl/glutamyl-tRNA(Asn/Gln) amidotransferase subunit C n=1 Tax=Desulfofarcimen acetoxidans (strain ATCC 49208 / DSM 771 / KCTC 5769 / VKM B-1644 / 5575) TaxID=485916 RepID=C8W210_DESAS|nr:Asp-tRNA(Asn)/Glu-tRNA(Gln) amidotransferase subunit GatC [Desulfofarcimen acetoxidans]ACV61674.1 glutamyl-tRNA(Gln) amidotransferase, C subunit [Desulfofarcimen acetoxidans DSM 771]